MSKWNYGVALTVGVLLAAPASAFAQTKALTDQDRTEIRQLSDNYVTFLDGCKSSEYAGLFAVDGSFISGPRGTMTGPEKLASLVTTEPFCKPGAPPRANGMSHAFSKVVIDAAPDGATGKVYLPGRDPGASGGHYEDRYVKTSGGWKFKSRTYLSPKDEQAAAPAQ